LVDHAEIAQEPPIPPEERDHYDHARTLLELREYDRFESIFVLERRDNFLLYIYYRSAYFLASSKHPKMVFMHHWAKFLASEKRNLDNMVEVNASTFTINI
jgi:hypothetical protein